MSPEGHQEFRQLRNECLTDLPAAIRRVKANPRLLEARNGIGETVMHWLAVENHVDAVQALLEAGAPVDSVNHCGTTVLTEAASLGYISMCKLLMEYGANPRMESLTGGSAILATAKKNKPELLELILSKLAPDEDLAKYFEPWELQKILTSGKPTARILSERGLKYVEPAE